MTLLLIDSFDSYPTIMDIVQRGWSPYASGLPLFDTVIKKDGYQSLELQFNDAIFFEFSPLLAGRAYVSFWFYFDDDTQSANSEFLQLVNARNTEHCHVRLRTDLKLELRGQTGTDLGLVSSQALVKDTWYHIECVMKMTNSTTSGDFVLKVDGAEWLSSTGDDCQYSSYAGAVALQFSGPAGFDGAFYMDDMVIWDDSGSGDFSDAFMGMLRVSSLEPNGNGTTNNFTGSDADSVDNYLHVDENTHDTDTSFNESSTVTDVDLYAFDNSPGDVDTIHAVQASMWVKKDTDTIRGVKNVARVNSTNYLGTERWLANGEYVMITNVWELNPDDAAAWETADIDAAEFGIQITT